MDEQEDSVRQWLLSIMAIMKFKQNEVRIEDGMSEVDCNLN